MVANAFNPHFSSRPFLLLSLLTAPKNVLNSRNVCNFVSFVEDKVFLLMDCPQDTIVLVSPPRLCLLLFFQWLCLLSTNMSFNWGTSLMNYSRWKQFYKKKWYFPSFHLFNSILMLSSPSFNFTRVDGDEKCLLALFSGTRMPCRKIYHFN